MRVFNAYLSDQNDYNDIRVAHAKLQCIEFLGRDRSCEDRLKERAQQSKDSKEALRIILELSQCDKKRSIGEYRTISID